jgi:anti-anti-sigma factor
MKITRAGETLSVSQIEQLAAANSLSFQSELKAALPSDVQQIDIDLSETGFADCTGLGALIALRNCARHCCSANVIIRLLNPKPPIRRIFDLTRLDRIFPIEERQGSEATLQPM